MKNLELYIHIPFCIRKCEYCDFLSAPASRELQTKYMEALRKEISAAKDYGKDRCVSTVFFGGGTPSIVDEEEIQKTMELLKSVFFIAENAEITIETNPGTLTERKLRRYREAGFNRLSIGCQSVHDDELRLLGRIHTYDQFRESYELARTAGFDNINVDLMSGLPGQTTKSWEESLQTIMDLKPEHISAYSLIIEEGTPFYEKDLELPEEEEERRMYERTAELLLARGWEQYEISNYAIPGKECRHNTGYWTREEYLGFGIGAASLWEEQRFSNLKNLGQYLEDSENLEKIHTDYEKLSMEEQIEETMYLGLRMNRGVSFASFAERFGRSMDTVYGGVLRKHIQQKLLKIEEGRVAFTDKGRDISNWVLTDFLLDEKCITELETPS